MSHTPGPWTYYDNTGALPLLGICGPDDKGIAHESRPYEQQEADARLIAAAPDLLAACQVMLKAVDEAYEATGFFRVARTSHERLQIEAAIAKATAICRENA